MSASDGSASENAHEKSESSPVISMDTSSDAKLGDVSAAPAPRSFFSRLVRAVAGFFSTTKNDAEIDGERPLKRARVDDSADQKTVPLPPPPPLDMRRVEWENLPINCSPALAAHVLSETYEYKTRGLIKMPREEMHGRLYVRVPYLPLCLSPPSSDDKAEGVITQNALSHDQQRQVHPFLHYYALFQISRRAVQCSV